MAATPAPNHARVYCWNVNGIRACTRKGFDRWLRRSGAFAVALQEVRAMPDQIPEAITRSRWHLAMMPAERRGYSGVAVLSREEPDEVWTELAPRFDVEGRMLVARFGRLALCSAYFPKGDGPGRDLSRIPYKLDFYDTLRERLGRMRRSGLRVLCAGDFNTAHHPIDLARPKQNVRNSGFRPEERETLDAWMRAGWVDTFRAFESGSGHYSWWSNRMGARERNVGWRIDYVLASNAAMRFVRGAFIKPQVTGSDHCPIGVDLDRAAFGAGRFAR
jgi:exodeoxyribonuclease-3